MIISEKNIKEKIKNIKLFLFDLDGVLLLRKDSNQEELLNCMIDFAGKLKSYGFFAGIITGRADDVLTKTLAGIDNCKVVTSSFDKVGAVKKLLYELQLSFDNVLYIGDDMLDIPLLQRAEIAIAPSTARREVKRVVDRVIDVSENKSILHYVLNMFGGFTNE